MSSTINTKILFLALLLCLGLNSLRGQSNESSLARNSLSNHTLLPADERTSAPSPSTILMISGKEYCVATHEVIAKEYCDFLNATAVDDIHQLYDERMGSDPMMACIIRLGLPGDYYYSVVKGAEDFVVAYVDRSSGARFCNWITNGQQSSDQDPETTEHGIYDFGQTIDDSPTVSMPQNKNSDYFLSGDIEASGIYETPISFYRSDPFLRSNISSLSIDILTPWSGVSQTLALCPTSNVYVQGAEAIVKDWTEVLLVGVIAAFFAGISILAFGAAATQVTERFSGKAYSIAAFVGTALAARSATDKVITKLTTKNGVQTMKDEGFSASTSWIIGMALGFLILLAGFTASPLIFVGFAGRTIAAERAAARVTASEAVANASRLSEEREPIRIKQGFQQQRTPGNREEECDEGTEADDRLSTPKRMVYHRSSAVSETKEKSPASQFAENETDNCLRMRNIIATSELPTESNLASPETKEKSPAAQLAENSSRATALFERLSILERVAELEKVPVLSAEAFLERAELLQQAESLNHRVGFSPAELQNLGIALQRTATEEKYYIFGLFKTVPVGGVGFSVGVLTMMQLAASLYGSAVGAHASTHLDPYIAKLLGNTGGH